MFLKIMLWPPPSTAGGHSSDPAVDSQPLAFAAHGVGFGAPELRPRLPPTHNPDHAKQILYANPQLGLATFYVLHHMGIYEKDPRCADL